MLIRNLLTVTIITALTGCGGSDSSNSSSSNQESMPLTGIFVDSAVSGLSYSTESLTGVTNSQGEYQYVSGESIVFSIGQLELPPVRAAQTITPLDIFSTDALTDRRVVNLSSLLQSIDENSDPEDGISITESMADIAPMSSQVDFNVSFDDFSQNVAVINMVSTNGSVLQGEFESVRHLQETLVGQSIQTVIVPSEWADLSRGTTHIYDNGARYYYREDGIRLSSEPWIEGLQETSWFVADDGQFCEVSTSGPTFCFGSGENFLLTTDGNGTYLYSDPTFTSSFTSVLGNGLNASQEALYSDSRRLQPMTSEELGRTLSGNTVQWGDGSLVYYNGSQIRGLTPDNESLVGVIDFSNDLHCRSWNVGRVKCSTVYDDGSGTLRFFVDGNSDSSGGYALVRAGNPEQL